MSRGKKSEAEKLQAKNSVDLCTNIPLSIPQGLLTQVCDNIDGDNRSAKLRTCIIQGYERITGEKPK